MKTFSRLLLLLILTAFSCKNQPKEEFEVKKADDVMMQNSSNLQVEVVNELDPVCGMDTQNHLSDTLHYNGYIMGFCSRICKEEFAQNPPKYLND